MKFGIAKAAGTVAFLIAVSKVLGFFRETSLAAVFGASSDMDAYLVALTIPYMFFEIVSYTLATTFIPVYLRIKQADGQDGTDRLTSSLINLIVVSSAVVVCLGVIFAEKFAQILAPGFDEATLYLTAQLSRVLLPMLAFQLLSGVANGVLQAHKRFNVPVAASLVQNVTIIVFVVFVGPVFGIKAAAIGTLLGTFLPLVIRMVVLSKLGYRWKPILDVRVNGLGKMMILGIPAIIGAGVGQINLLIDRMLASGLTEGSIASLNYAARLMQLAPSILGTSVVTVVYPTLASMAARRNWMGLGNNTASALSMIYFILAPITAGAVVLREPLVRIVFERGAFDSLATSETAWAFLFLALGMAFLSMKELLDRAFFALEDTLRPALFGIGGVAVNIGLNFALIGPMRQGGLALATSIATVVSLLLGILAFRRRFPFYFPLKRLLASVSRTSLASFIMGVVAWVAFGYIKNSFSGSGLISEFASVVVTAGVGVVVYILLVWLLRVPELGLVMRGIKGLNQRMQLRN